MDLSVRAMLHLDQETEKLIKFQGCGCTSCKGSSVWQAAQAPAARLHFMACRLAYPQNLLLQQVVDETEPFQGGLIGISSFGFGGANFHAVVEARAGQRIRLYEPAPVAAPAAAPPPVSSSSGSDSGSEASDKPQMPMVPIVARTATGLAYLAKTIMKVGLD